MPGHPLVYATSKNFMDYFGINTPEDLPKIREVLADQVVEPTVVHHTDFEQSEVLAVSDSGELLLVEPGEEEEETPELNGHTFSELAPEEENEETVPEGDNEGTDSPEEGETIEDEAVSEEYIADEIFADEEVMEETQELEAELLEDDDTAEGDIPEEGETEERDGDDENENEEDESEEDEPSK
jgi:segregation and condensation protein B